MNDHDILKDVLGLDRARLATLTPWQLAALAREVLDFIEVPMRGEERRRILVAKEAVTNVRDFYD